VKNCYLEGAGWDFENGCLTDPDPMELIVSMPIIHFKPTVGLGLYKLNPADPHSLKAPGFIDQPSNLKTEKPQPVSSLSLFQIQLVTTLHHGHEEEERQGHLQLSAVHVPRAHGVARAPVVHGGEVLVNRSTYQVTVLPIK
jgi:hypothetical protein